MKIRAQINKGNQLFKFRPLLHTSVVIMASEFFSMSPFSPNFDVGCLPKIVPALIFQLCVLSKNQRWFDISASDVISAVRKVAIKAVFFCGSSKTISCVSLNDCKKCLVVFQLTISKRVFSWYTKLCFVEQFAKISSCFSIIYLPRTLWTQLPK